MSNPAQPEVWLRGAVPGIMPLLQPVAHALLQANEEIPLIMAGFPDRLLWEKPAGLASPGFHLQHITGVLQRLFAYASGRQLTLDELAFLTNEGSPGESHHTAQTLVNELHEQIKKAIAALRVVNE